jgi:hypothetical protein
VQHLRDISVPIHARAASSGKSAESMVSAGQLHLCHRLPMIEDDPDNASHDDSQDDENEDPVRAQDDLDEEPHPEDDLEAYFSRASAVTRLQRLPDLGASSIELEKIPRGLWQPTLKPFRRLERGLIARRVADKELREVAVQLTDEMATAEWDAAEAHRRAGHWALRTGHPLPNPSVAHAAARSTVQVNLRLRRDDHERVVQAAKAVGLKPTTLARALVLNGAAMILRDHGREHLAPPARPIYTPLSLD